MIVLGIFFLLNFIPSETEQSKKKKFNKLKTKLFSQVSMGFVLFWDDI